MTLSVSLYKIIMIHEQGFAVGQWWPKGKRSELVAEGLLVKLIFVQLFIDKVSCAMPESSFCLQCHSHTKHTLLTPPGDRVSDQPGLPAVYTVFLAVRNLRACIRLIRDCHRYVAALCLGRRDCNCDTTTTGPPAPPGRPWLWVPPAFLYRAPYEAFIFLWLQQMK